MKKICYSLILLGFLVLTAQSVNAQCQTAGNCCQCPNPPINSAKGVQHYKGHVRKVLNNCCACSPIIIDTSGTGFDLTGAAGGVSFDISGTGHPIQMAWTAPGSHNAFLCLPDANGTCDDGKDLFGSFTPQPPSSTPNGFAALAVYDQPANGGNGDGIIDSHDAIFSSLRLWIDWNHDGISQPNELYTLPALGVESISLDYKESMKKDKYGNVFRYRAGVSYDNPSSPGSQVAYDVFLVTLASSPAKATASNHAPRSDAAIKPTGK